jgi:hypothetical protein
VLVIAWAQDVRWQTATSFSLTHAYTLAIAFSLAQDDEGSEPEDDEEGDGEMDPTDDDDAAEAGAARPKKARKSGLLEASDSEPDEDDGATRFAREQAKIKKRIAALEEFNLGEKPWELSGGACVSVLNRLSDQNEGKTMCMCERASERARD